MIHRNSRRAWTEFDAPRRAMDVMAVLRKHRRPMTDREICEALGSGDMNYARPSITVLKQQGVLCEVMDVWCPKTNRSVRAVWFAGEKP